MPDLLRVTIGEEFPAVDPAIQASAFAFLDRYRRYTPEVDREPARGGRAPAPGKVRDDAMLRRAVSQRHAAQYWRAMEAADRHLADFAGRIGERVRGERTYLIVLKSQYLGRARVTLRSRTESLGWRD